MTFEQLQLSKPLLRAVKEYGYRQPTPIQQKAIPPALAGRDLIGCAQTGTGKTAAFALPILQQLAARPAKKAKAIRALILTPTRELALQIGDCFAQYEKYLTLRHTVIFGGVGQKPQTDALAAGVDILVACPGRLNDLAGQGFIDLSALEIFVLDEADRMLDMGFIHDVKKVIRLLPPQRQSLLFSATMPKEIVEIADHLLHDPAFVKVNPVSSPVDKIDQSVYFVTKGNKQNLLPWLILNRTDPPVENALVFSRTKHGADKIVRILEKHNISAAAIHGNKGQNARIAALEGFKEGKTRVLVATDIAARGIDINELSYVFNYDLPEVPETYVHRIGRTARAGAEGTAISFCSPEEQEYLQGIEKLIRKSIPVISGHPWEGLADPPKTPPPPRGKKPAVPEAPAAKAEAKPQKQAAAKKNTPPAPVQHSTPEQKAPKAKAPRQAEHTGTRPTAEGNRAVPSPNRKEPPMEHQNPNPEGTLGLSASAKRRRRRRRIHEEGAAAVTTPAAAAPAPEREEAPQRRQRPTFDPHFLGESISAPLTGAEKQPQPQKPAKPLSTAAAAPQPAKKPATRPQQTAAKAPAPEPKRETPVKKAATKNASTAETGLLLISRRPPQQKFASFEDYMKAHGGETSPIEEYTEE